MGRGSGAGRLSAGSYGGGKGGANRNVSNNPLVNKLVDMLNNASGFVRLTQNDKAQQAINISSSTDVGDSFTFGNTKPIVKIGNNAWDDGTNTPLTSGQVLQMAIDAVNIGMKVKFKSK